MTIFKPTGYPDIDSLISEARELFSLGLGEGHPNPCEEAKLHEWVKHSVQATYESGELLNVFPELVASIEHHLLGQPAANQIPTPIEQPPERLIRASRLADIYALEAAEYRKLGEPKKTRAALHLAALALSDARKARDEYRVHVGPSKGGKERQKQRKMDIESDEVRKSVIEHRDQLAAKYGMRRASEIAVGKTGLNPNTVRRWKSTT